MFSHDLPIHTLFKDKYIFDEKVVIYYIVISDIIKALQLFSDEEIVNEGLESRPVAVADITPRPALPQSSSERPADEDEGFCDNSSESEKLKSERHKNKGSRKVSFGKQVREIPPSAPDQLQRPEVKAGEGNSKMGKPSRKSSRKKKTD